MIAEGVSQEMQNDEDVIATYLGTDEEIQTPSSSYGRAWLVGSQTRSHGLITASLNHKRAMFSSDARSPSGRGLV